MWLWVDSGLRLRLLLSSPWWAPHSVISLKEDDRVLPCGRTRCWYPLLPKKKPGLSHPPLPRISNGGGPADAARLLPRPVPRRDLSEYLC